MTKQRPTLCHASPLDAVTPNQTFTVTKDESDLQAVAARYAVRSTPYLDRLLAQAPPDSPLARQYLPSLQELHTTPDELEDPIGDAVKSPLPGIVHRYPDRALLKPVHACAAYCRFCFRREQVGPGGEVLNDEELNRALDYLRTTPAIWEVVLTGGDPLILSPRRLSRIIGALEDMAHVEVLRIHTRLPLHEPSRISDELIAALSGPNRKPEQLTIWLAIHINHRSELTPEVITALRKMQAAGLPLISQTVLLRGVNDDAQSLCDLFRALVRYGVKPYYLHHPDPAPGTSHFRLGIEDGVKIVQEMHSQLSGIARPTYILDRPNGAGKVQIPLYAPPKA